MDLTPDTPRLTKVDPQPDTQNKTQSGYRATGGPEAGHYGPEAGHSPPETPESGPEVGHFSEKHATSGSVDGQYIGNQMGAPEGSAVAAARDDPL